MLLGERRGCFLAFPDDLDTPVIHTGPRSGLSGSLWPGVCAEDVGFAAITQRKLKRAQERPDHELQGLRGSPGNTTGTSVGTPRPEEAEAPVPPQWLENSTCAARLPAPCHLREKQGLGKHPRFGAFLSKRGCFIYRICLYLVQIEQRTERGRAGQEGERRHGISF